jgi:hypothetical protein
MLNVANLGYAPFSISRLAPWTELGYNLSGNQEV